MEKKFKCMICDKIYDFDKDKRPILKVTNMDRSIGVYDGCCKPGSLIEIKKWSMESKFYVPSIDEFHVGFEFEVSNSIVGGTMRIRPPEEWYKQIYGQSDPYNFDFIKYMLEIGNPSNIIRVKHIDHEDIESLGFDPSFDEPLEWFHSYKGNFDVQLYFDDKIREDNDGVGISIHDHTGIVFNGFLKNKSELKKLLKQLGIQ